MVEKGAAVRVRVLSWREGAALQAIGLVAALLTLDRCRNVRAAVEQRLRLKADILKLASTEPGRRQCSLEKGGKGRTRVSGGVAGPGANKGYSSACPQLLAIGSGMGRAAHNRGRESSSGVISGRKLSKPLVHWPPTC